LSTTFLQGSVATRVNYCKIFNDFFIANLLLNVMVKKFRRSVRIRQNYGEKSSGTFFPDAVYIWIRWLLTRTYCSRKKFLSILHRSEICATVACFCLFGCHSNAFCSL